MELCGMRVIYVYNVHCLFLLSCAILRTLWDCDVLHDCPENPSDRGSAVSLTHITQQALTNHQTTPRKAPHHRIESSNERL